MFGDNLKLQADFSKPTPEPDSFNAQPVLYLNKDVNPDTRAQSLELQKKTGLPVETIEADLSTFKAEDVFNSFSLADYTNYPVTTAGLAHPQESPLYRDDAKNLSGWEKLIDGIGKSWQAGQRQATQRDIWLKKMVGTATEDDMALDKRLDAESQGYKPGGNFENFFAQIPSVIAEAAPIYLQALAGSADKAAAGGAAGALVGGGPGAAAGLAMGTGYGTMIEIGKTEAALAYQEYSNLKDITGKPINDDAAKGAAAIVGIMNGSVEMLGGKVAAKVTGLDKVASLFARGNIKKLMQIPAMRDVFTKVGRTLGGGAFTEGFTEAWQEANTAIIGQELAATFNADASPLVLSSWSDNVKRIGQAGKGGAQMGVGFGGPHAAMGAFVEYSKVKSFSQNAELTKEIAGLMEGSKTYQRMPQKWRDHIAALKEEYGVSHDVTMPLQVLQTYFQEAGINADQVAKEMPQTAEALRKAQATGSDVAIPIEEYAETFARSENFQPYVQDVRMHPQLPTDREVADLRKTLKEMADNVPVKDTSVLDDIRSKIVNAESPAVADFQALLHYHWYDTQAKELGIPVEQLYKQQTVDIERTGFAGPDTQAMVQMIQDGQVPTDSHIYGPSLQEFIKQYGDNQTTREEAVARGYFDTGDLTSMSDAQWQQALADEKPRYAYGSEDTGKLEIRRRADTITQQASAMGLDLSQMSADEAAKKLGAGFNQTAAQVEQFRKANNLPEIKMRKDGSHPTQIATTKSTYRKIFDESLTPEAKKGRILDYGAGKNIGGQEIGAETFEPFPEKGFSPTFTQTSDIPSNTFHTVINNAVLNVVPDDVRDSIVHEIGRVLAPGGQAFINARGKDVFAAKHTVIDKDTKEVIIDESGAYQKGFDQGELVEYLQKTLGDGFDVSRPAKKFGSVTAVITKKDTVTTNRTSEVAPGADNLSRQAQAGFEKNPATGEVEFNPVRAALGIADGDQTYYQGIEKPGEDGRFLRGAASQQDNMKIVSQALSDNSVINVWDGVKTVADAHAWAEQITWLEPTVEGDRKTLRWKANEEGMYGNSKMMFPSYSFPRGRNTWDIPGCGREAWAVINGIDIKQACYGGACYAEALTKAKQGLAASVSSGVKVKPLTDADLRVTMNDYYKQNGLEKTQAKWPQYQVKENTTKGSKNFGNLSIGIVTDALPAAVVTTKLQPAKGADIRLGVDTDGAAWLSNPKVMDAILAANPRTLTVYSSAYHVPPPPHQLAGRTIINVTVSGWHPLPETLARIKWAEEARKNGWNVILREVVANPDQFGLDTANQYNRLHEALLKTDFFIIQQPLHIGATNGEPMWGLPACCKGTEKNLHTCDQCEVAEGLGKKFQEYWAIHEEKDVSSEIVMPDSPYEGRTLFQNQDEQSPRGFITMNRARDYFKITLTGQADLSTFLHESGHLFLEMMDGLARQEGAPARIVNDMNVVRKWLGMKPGEDFTREHHEQWARMFEQYLMEGKAPSAELRSAFARFKAWLTAVYKDIRNLGMPLTEEVRGVMDRMFASEEAINRTAELEKLTPIFGNKEVGGMSETEYAEYMIDFSQGMTEAEDNLFKRLVREMTAHTNTQHREAIRQIRAEVDHDVKTRPVYQALHFLKTGTMIDGTIPSGGMLGKLDRGVLTRMFPDLKYTGRLAKITAQGGADPTVVAHFFGFKSADDMLQALLAAPDMASVIKSETQERFKTVFGDSLNPKDMVDLARKSLHNDRIGSMLTREVVALNKMIKKVVPVGFIHAIQQFASDQINDTEVRKLQPHVFAAAEQRYGKQAWEAAAKNEWTTAADAKRAQLMNHYLYRKATEAQAEAAKIRNYLHEFESVRKRKQLGLAGGHYLEAVDALLAGVGLANQSLVTVSRRKALKTYLEMMEAQGQIVVIPDEIRDEANLKNYKTMTVEEFRGIRDAVKNINHLATKAAKLALAKDQRDFRVIMDEINKGIQDRAGTFISMKKQNPTAWEQGMAKLRSLDAQLLKTEFLIRQLDGGIAGKLHSLIFEPLSQAQAKKFDMLKDFNKKLYDPLRKMPKEQKARMATEYSFLGTTMKGHEIMAVALNMGNEGNLHKLIEGYKDRGWTEDSLMKELDRILTKEDWKMVQHIWDQVNTLWPMIADLSKRTTGLAPVKVEPRKIVSRHGIFDGGYYPVIYDKNRVYKALSDAQKSNNIFENNYMSPKVGSGFAVQRTAYTAPIQLSLDGLPKHTNDVIHYLTHFEAVTQANRVISDPDFQVTVSQAIGREYYNELKPWLQSIANEGKSDMLADFADRFASRVATGMSIMTMGFNISTSFMQILGLTSSLSELGPRYLVSGMKGMLIPEQRQFAYEQSAELRHTIQTFNRDARASYVQMLATIAGEHKYQYIHAQMTNFAFALMGVVQLQANMATWIGAYNKACAEGITAAAAHADAIVRMTQAGEGAKDLARIQRPDKPFRKLITPFYTYFSVLYGQLRAAGMRMPAEPVIAMAQLATLVLLPPLCEQLLRKGLPSDDDPADEWFKSYFKNVASFGLATLPILRDFVQPFMADYGSYSMAPGATVLAGTLQAAKSAYTKEGELTASQIKALARGVGVFLHMPTNQIIKSATFLDALIDGEIEEPIREFIFGVKQKK